MQSRAWMGTLNAVIAPATFAHASSSALTTVQRTYKQTGR